MSNPVIFKDLPATFPEKAQHKASASIGSVVVHSVFVAALIMVPLLFPAEISTSRLLTLIVAVPQPPPPAAPPAAAPVAKAAAPARPRSMAPNAIIVPVEVPKTIAWINDEAVGSVPSGVVGGIPGGVMGGVLEGLSSTNVPRPEFVPPPPAPPPRVEPVKEVATAPSVPASPVRVGGSIREPRIIHDAAVIYPELGIKARIEGVVLLEATITADGTVDSIRVVSGPPLLVDAAIDCVKKWQYEPTLLNGNAVPIILTVRVNFKLRRA